MSNIAVALMCTASLLIVGERPSFAQAGSTGGTLGKTGKSVSGGEEHSAPSPKKRPIRKPAVESTVASRSITGEWSSNWDLGPYHIRQSGKSFTWVLGSQRGHGTIDGDEVQASWSGGQNSGSAKGVISKDGNTITWDNTVVMTRR